MFGLRFAPKLRKSPNQMSELSDSSRFAVERGVLTHVGERLLKILGVAVGPVGREIRFF